MGLYRGARAALIGVGMGGVFGLMGGQEAMDAINNKEPHVMSCEEFQQGAPEKVWVKLTNCSMNIAAATYFYDEKTNKIKDLYIPVFPNIESSPEKTKISLHSTNSEWINLVSQVRTVSSDKDKLTDLIAKNQDKFYVNADVEGTIEHGMNKDSSEHSKLSQLDQDLAPGFSVVKHNDKPDLAFGLVMMAGGFVAAIVGLLRGVRNLRH